MSRAGDGARMRVLGMMSGTSFDAIDAAVADIELEGEVLRLRPLGSLSAPYADDLREELAAALPPAPTTLETVCRLDTRIGRRSRSSRPRRSPASAPRT